MKLETVVFAIAGTCSAVLAANDTQREVRCAEIAFSRSAERGDRERFRAAIDAEAWFVGAAVHDGPEAIVAAWEPFFADGGPRIRWRPDTVKVLPGGEMAFTRGPYRLIEPGGKVSWGTFNSVWRRGRDGRWRVVFDAGTEPGRKPTDSDRAVLELGDDCEVSPEIYPKTDP